MTDTQKLTGDQIEAEGLADWRVLFHALQTRYRTGNFATGLTLVTRIGQAAEQSPSRPGPGSPTSRAPAQPRLGVTARDVRRLGRSPVRAGLGVGRPASSRVELGLDTPDHAAIKPFCVPSLGSRPPRTRRRPARPCGRLARSGCTARPHETPRQRFHLDIRVPPEVAQQRIAAALEAGGTWSATGSQAFVVCSPRRQRAPRLHLAGPRLLSQHVGPTYRMLGRLADWLDCNGARRRRWSHAQGHCRMHATRVLNQTRAARPAFHSGRRPGS